MYAYKGPQLRGDDEIAAMVGVLNTDPAYARNYGTDGVRGAKAALEWVLGRRIVSPVAEKVCRDRPSGSEAKNERYQAYERMYNTRGAGSREYYTGVENALAWVTGKGDDGLVQPAEWRWRSPQDA